LQNFTLRNSSIPQNINLLDLAVVDSQEFLVTFKSVELLPVAGALIDITRKYINEGVFKTVELPLTDDEGQVIAHLVLSDEIYTFINNVYIFHLFFNFILWFPMSQKQLLYFLWDL
ncbi:hypothetical protein LCGC14_2656090, partial [marine sediment metagenome]